MESSRISQYGGYKVAQTIHPSFESAATFSAVFKIIVVHMQSYNVVHRTCASSYCRYVPRVEDARLPASHGPPIVKVREQTLLIQINERYNLQLTTPYVFGLLIKIMYRL